MDLRRKNSSVNSSMGDIMIHEMRSKINIRAIIFATACILSLTCAAAGAAEIENGAAAGTRPGHDTLQGRLAPEAAINYDQIVEESKRTLEEMGISRDSYDIGVIADANLAVVRAADRKVRETVWRTIQAIEKNHISVTATEVIALQYANATGISEMLSNIYSRKTIFLKDDEKITVKKDDNGIDISPDPRTNSIIVTGPRTVLGAVREMVKKLDRKTDQIHIKVLIAEVTLDDTTQYGVEWKFADTTLLGDSKVTPSSTVDFGYQSEAKKNGLMGFKYSVLSGDNLNMFLQMLRSQSHIDVLASPELLSSNNTKSRFQETVKVPVQKTTSTATGLVSTSTEYQDVGIDLTVLPQVNIDGYINLDISQTIQSIIETLNNKQNAPTYSNRVIKTNVLVKNGATVVIGGLFKNNEGATISKVPIAGNLPVIGKLFTRNQKNRIKTELMVFLTPELARTDEDFETTARNVRAPEIRKRLEDTAAVELAGASQKEKKKIKVISYSDERTVISAGALDGVKPGDEFLVVRQEKEYYHPETHQLVSVEEKEIARIKVDIVKDRTSLATLLALATGENVLAGDTAALEDSPMLFENFRIRGMKVDFTPAEDYRSTAVRIDMRIKNTTRNPLLRTKLMEKMINRMDTKKGRKVVTKDTGKYDLRIVENGRATPLKLTEKIVDDGLETLILFNRIIGPEEEISVTLAYELYHGIFQMKDLERQIADERGETPVNTNIGPKDPKASVGFSINFRNPIIAGDFTPRPAVIENAMGGTTLAWTQNGAPLRISGKWRFEDPAAVRKRIAAKGDGENSKKIREVR